MRFYSAWERAAKNAVLFHRYFRQVFGLAFKRIHRSRLHLNSLESLKPCSLVVMT